jgi:hypothetical protein
MVVIKRAYVMNAPILLGRARLCADWYASNRRQQQQQRERRACRLWVYKALTSVHSHHFRALPNDAVPHHMQQCNARITSGLSRRRYCNDLRALIIVACLHTACFAHALL